MNLQIQRQIAIYHNIERHIFSIKTPPPHQTKQTNQKGQKYTYEW